jgi:prepilin-type N-terminal cleavage/methylation domain-containing protein
MKTTQHHNKRAGFTLIEMVGVLAVIAILAALLVPKIFAAINESRLNNAIGSFNTVKTAAISHFAKTGSFPVGADYDATLLSAGLLEKPFECKLAATSADAEVITSVDTDNPTDGKGDFDLDGNGTFDEVPAGSSVVQIKLVGVKPDDAWELSKRIDGDGMSAANATSNDLKGRVVYAASGPTYTVYVYLAHK